MDPNPPPPSYDDVVKGGFEPSAPPLAGENQGGPPSQLERGGGAAYPYPSQQAGYPQGSAYGQPAVVYSDPQPWQAQGTAGGGGFPQYTYAPVQVQGGVMNPQPGGYQYNTSQQMVNPVTVTAGYQTTPLAYGGGTSSILRSQHQRKIVLLVTCMILVAFIVVIVLINAILF